jgi:hypothetical protein
VTLSAHFLSKYEMTQGQWLRLAGRNPAYYKQNDFARDAAAPGGAGVLGGRGALAAAGGAFAAERGAVGVRSASGDDLAALGGRDEGGADVRAGEHRGPVVREGWG